MNVQLLEQAQELKRRLAIRGSLAEWARICLDREPALHHKLLIEKLEEVVAGKCRRLIVMMPPGSAKSSYTSWALPPWYLAKRPGHCLLSCSYSYDFVQGWGRRCRNSIEANEKLLGYTLAKDSKAAGEWETSNGGRYFCAGVNSGIAGHRADLGLIDDPIGSEMEADSKLFRDRLWDWFWNDFTPRRKPGASIVIICNRRHEDDLVGRLLDPKRNPNGYQEWQVLSLPMIAGENDVLGRVPGDRLWPEWFTESMVKEAQTNPRTWSGLYQQNPTPESGDFFKRDWIVGYAPNELPKNLRIYAASDHAVSTERGANASCFIPFGIDEDGHIWILPDVFWKTCTPGDAVEAMLQIVRNRRPIKWRAEKGHISKSLLPLIQKRMQETGLFFVIEQVTPSRDKRTRAGSVAGLMQMLKVHFPTWTEWWPNALFELMSFTGSGDDKSDDFCDALAHIGMMVSSLTSPSAPVAKPVESLDMPVELTGRWLKESANRLKQPAELDK